MLKLLHAGFFRYLHSTAFKVCALCTFLLGVLFAYQLSDGVELNEYWFFGETAVFVILITLSVGTEMRSGIRPKLVCGYRRTTVFFSELILADLMVTLFFGMFLLLSLALNLPILGHLPVGALLLCVLGFYVMAISFASGLAALSCVLSSRVLSAVVCLVLAMALYLFSGAIAVMLDEDEFLEYGAVDPETQEMITCQEENPDYVHEPWRSLLTAFLRVNPYGQRADYEEILFPFLFNDEAWERAKEATANTMGNQHLERVISEEEQRFLQTAPLCSLVPALCIVLGGWLIFRKKAFR